MIKLTNLQRNFITELDLVYRDYGFVKAYEKEENKILLCQVPNKYDLVYGSYYIKHDFKLSFAMNEKLLRFGIVNDGISEFKIKDKKTNYFLPSSFIAIEDHLLGTQTFKEGYFYQGIEVFLKDEYIKVLKENFPELNSLSMLPSNQAILFLPTKLRQTFTYLECQILNKSISPLMLESKILEAISLIAKEINKLEKNDFLHKLQLRALRSKEDYCLSTEEIRAIEKAHDILTSMLQYPPSIKQLSEELFISEQKLTLGFKKIYESTIGQYIKNQRLHEAANLLTMSEISIDEISTLVGYSHPSNFSKAFKRKYMRTPLKYRKDSLKK